MEYKKYLTVKQFAVRAGVSTQRIYQLLTKSLQEFCKVENGTKYISIEGLRVFDKSPLQGVAKDLQRDLQGVASPETELLRETIETLRQQLMIKDEQLAAKDNQIADITSALVSAQEQHKALTDALTTAQALHAGTLQERLTVQTDSSKWQTETMAANIVPDETRKPAQEQQQNRRRFFARMFGRK